MIVVPPIDFVLVFTLPPEDIMIELNTLHAWRGVISVNRNIEFINGELSTGVGEKMSAQVSNFNVLCLHK